MHKGGQRLDDSHEASQGTLLAMKRPDWLASIAEDENVLLVLSPRL